MMNLAGSESIRNFRQTALVPILHNVRSIQQRCVSEFTDRAAARIRFEHQLTKTMLMNTTFHRDRLILAAWRVDFQREIRECNDAVRNISLKSERQ